MDREVLRNRGLLWKRQFAGNDGADGLATDEEGNVFITGFTDGSLFGPNQGDHDAWVKKYSPAGAVLWKRQLGTPGFDAGWLSQPTSKGGVYIAGATSGINRRRQPGRGRRVHCEVRPGP